MATIPEALAIALDHHRAGRLQAAEQIYRRVLSVNPQHADTLHLLGLIALQTGRSQAAIDCIASAIRVNGSNPVYHKSLGQVYGTLLRFDDAIACYQRAVRLNPAFAEAHFCLGKVLKDAGRCDEAIASYQRAVQLNPGDFMALNNLGVALKDRGSIDQAIDCYRRALQLRPNDPQPYNNLGIALQECGRIDEAITSYQRALDLGLDSATVYFNLGTALASLEKLDEAIACFRQALMLDPNLAECHLALGNALAAQSTLDDAIIAYQHALRIDPDNARAQFNLGTAFKSQRKLDDAILCFRRASALEPKSAESHLALGNSLAMAGVLDEAAVCYRQAMDLKPDFAECHLAVASLHLLAGDFAHGWPEYEWRWRIKDAKVLRRNFAQPRWDGSEPGGRTILLHAEQGCGDAIQCARYAPLLASRGARVIVECPGELQRLLQTLHGVEQVIARGQTLPPFDLHCPIMSLPLAFATTLQSIPGQVPYLRADPEASQRWRQRLAGDPHRLKVGLAWAGNPAQQDDRARSMPLASLAPLARVPGVSFYSLQKGEGAKQAQSPPPGLGLIDWTEDLADYADTAALISGLDLVISVCTSVAHLAGALGKPVWTLLAKSADWRWLLNRDDSPWYPTMRLFRQSIRDDWSAVIDRATANLRSLSQHVPEQPRPR